MCFESVLRWIYKLLQMTHLCFFLKISMRAFTKKTVGSTAVTFFSQTRSVNVNRSTQTKWNLENEAVSQRRTDYDFDKEQWMKQMKFASMDCIMDPSITPIRFTSFAGCKRGLKRWITMRKLNERRPEFKLDSLRDLFVKFKTYSHSSSLEDVKALQRITTHNETNRISKEIQERLNDEFSKKSWKSIKMKESTSESSYAIDIESFDLVNCYMGQMSQEDWLQITVKCQFKERLSSLSEWEKLVEYPVFEVRLGDGIKSANNHPFIVVGVMRKDGTRYGKDAQDAATLRKNFDRSNSWF